MRPPPDLAADAPAFARIIVRRAAPIRVAAWLILKFPQKIPFDPTFFFRRIVEV